jgi:hypothetical protein
MVHACIRYKIDGRAGEGERVQAHPEVVIVVDVNPVVVTFAQEEHHLVNSVIHGDQRAIADRVATTIPPIFVKIFLPNTFILNRLL